MCVIFSAEMSFEFLVIVYDIFGRNTWQADFGTLPPETHQKPPKQPVESYRKSVSKIFKRKFYFLVVFHVKSVYAQEIGGVF